MRKFSVVCSPVDSQSGAELPFSSSHSLSSEPTKAGVQQAAHSALDICSKPTTGRPTLGLVVPSAALFSSIGSCSCVRCLQVQGCSRSGVGAVLQQSKRFMFPWNVNACSGFLEDREGCYPRIVGFRLATASSGDYVNLMVIEYPFFMGSSPIEKVNPANKEPKVLLTNSVGSNYPAFNRFRIYKWS